jgi:hypothetical protein
MRSNPAQKATFTSRMAVRRPPDEVYYLNYRSRSNADFIFSAKANPFAVRR